MTKILFVSALSAELKIVKEEIKKLNFKNIEISFLESWIWNYNTIFNLTKFLEQNNNFDFIINIWVCGYSFHSMPLLQDWEFKKVIQIWRIKNLANNKEKIIPNFLNFAEIESIACSENIVYNSSEIKEENFVDMESYWFELVAEKYNLPRIILKVPVDEIWEETKKFDFVKAKKFLKENIDYKKLMSELEEFLESKNLNLFDKKEEKLKNKILTYYKWTFSEKVILEKEINKFLVLELWDIEKFFEENKNLDKKEFLKRLKNII